MLRHYDRLSLLRPVWVDPITGYRQYSATQLPRLNRLLALKDLGFTVEQTGPILDAEVSADELRGMLILRRAQVAEQLQTDQARLDAIERRLRMIESEGQMSELEFVDKPLDAAHVPSSLPSSQTPARSPTGWDRHTNASPASSNRGRSAAAAVHLVVRTPGSRPSRRSFLSHGARDGAG